MKWLWHYLILIRVILILVRRHLWIEMQCTWKTFMIHQTFVRWALYILLKFVKSLTRHLDLAIGNVWCVQWFSWTLEMAHWIFWTMWLTSIRHWHNTIMSHWHLNDINPNVFASWVHVIQTGAIIKRFMNLMTLYTALQWLRQNINQSMNSQKMTPYFTLKGATGCLLSQNWPKLWWRIQYLVYQPISDIHHVAAKLNWAVAWWLLALHQYCTDTVHNSSFHNKSLTAAIHRS